MNFFKQISSAVDKINSIGNMTHQKNFNNPKPDPLMDLIRTCNYSDDVKFTIQKSVKQILQVYPSYIFDKLEYTEAGFQKRFIELKGEIHVELRGKIRLHIMYPATFPKNAPYLRIINPNTTEFAPTMMYLPLQSKTDTKSYVLNERLQSVKKWNSSTSVVSLILEANNLIKANFPFQPISQMTGGTWGNNQINQGFSQQNQYPTQYNQYNQGFNQHVKQPPIPFQAGNYASFYPKAHALVTTQRKKVQELKTKHQPLLANIQSLSAASYAIQSQSFSLHTQNQKMLSFVNSGYDNQEVDLLQVVVPSDLLSKQILELTSSIKGREDTIHFLESKFNDQDISLEAFMKNLRKMEEGKFQEKALLIKCLQNVSKIMA